MSKPFKTLEEQIKILEDRGLSIPDYDYAISILSQLNYYNLINGYKKPFLNNDNSNSNDDVYIKGSSFNEIYALHELDRQLKLIVFNSLLRFEKLLKSSCSYHFSKVYKDGLYPYLQVENYSKSKHQLKFVLNNISTLSNAISRENGSVNGKKSIKHYINKHDHIPLWVLVNFLTLGNMSYFFNSLEESLQNAIAKDFGERYKTDYNSKEKISKTELIEIIKLCNFFRNICAHDEVMYSFTLKKSGQTAIFKKFFDKDYTGENLHDLILALRLVLPKDEYEFLRASISSIKIEFEDKFRSISIDNISSIAGF